MESPLQELSDAIVDVSVSPQSNISGKSFTLPKETRYACMECLISGSSESDGCVDEFGGAVGLLLRSLKACSHDVRAAVADQLIFAGGGAMIPGGLPIYLSAC